MQDVDDDRDTAPLDKLTEPLGLRLVYMVIYRCDAQLRAVRTDPAGGPISSS